MEDRKQIMSWLEGLEQDDWPMYHSDSEVQEIAKNALELLKEQVEHIERLEHDLAVTQNNLNYYVNGND